MYKGKEIPAPLTSSFGGTIPEGLLKDNKPARPERLQETRRGYAAASSFVDAMLGKILDELKKNGRFDNSVIVFFSDHGIFMGNHGRVHKGTVFNEITNPCLIVHYPKDFKTGLIEKRPVELLSLVKTALDIAGAPKTEKQKPFGESLMPLLTGRGTYKTQYAFSEIEGFQSCFDGRYRYIENKEKPLLYDLQNDQGEMKNIAKSNPDLVRIMQIATDQWAKRTGPFLPANHLKDENNLENWKRPAV
jgi:arylsulfatase A-like enzyme